MKLLIFAHNAEAQAFLSQSKFTKQLSNVFDYFEGRDFDILICGEGPIEALKATLYTLAHKKYTRVINLGIAGALTGELKKGDIVQVRTAYGEDAFKSHTSLSKSIIDCITSHSRVLTKESKTKLQPFADIVDRELWGIAEACKVIKIPFESYKYISDNAESEECLVIKAQACDISHELYQYYQSQQNTPTKVQLHENLPEMITTFINQLSPTFTQRVQLETLFKKCLLKKIETHSLFDLTSYEGYPRKKRNQIIIKKLLDLIDPIQKEIQKACDSFGAMTTIKALPNPEAMHLELKATIHSQEDLNQVIKDLSSLEIHTLERLYGGDIDVS